MSDAQQRRTTLSELIGLPVRGPEGSYVGRVAECVLEATDSGTHVSRLVLTSSGRMNGKRASAADVASFRLDVGHGLAVHEGDLLVEFEIPADAVLLERDLLDQQIIDMNGNKVVRVNDVDLVWEVDAKEVCALRIAEVEVGLRGALRRLLKGLPRPMVERVAQRVQPRVIPWEFVDLIDRDPARRVRLKIGQDRLSGMHPSDIADILEELAPAEREAVFTSLNQEVAAEALEEVDPKLQRALIEKMDSSRVADIVEEMDPGAAADLLAELPEERSGAILDEMEPSERQEVEELLEFPQDWAAGRMTTDYVAVGVHGSVADSIAALHAFEGDVDTLTEVYLVNEAERLSGIVSLGKLLLASPDAALKDLKEPKLHFCHVDANGREVAELFDKYNLRSLPVVDDTSSLVGVIHAEHVIGLLREER